MKFLGKSKISIIFILIPMFMLNRVVNTLIPADEKYYSGKHTDEKHDSSEDKNREHSPIETSSLTTKTSGDFKECFQNKTDELIEQIADCVINHTLSEQNEANVTIRICLSENEGCKLASDVLCCSSIGDTFQIEFKLFRCHVNNTSTTSSPKVTTTVATTKQVTTTHKIETTSTHNQATSTIVSTTDMPNTSTSSFEVTSHTTQNSQTSPDRIKSTQNPKTDSSVSTTHKPNETTSSSETTAHTGITTGKMGTSSHSSTHVKLNTSTSSSNLTITTNSIESTQNLKTDSSLSTTDKPNETTSSSETTSAHTGITTGKMGTSPYSSTHVKLSTSTSSSKTMPLTTYTSQIATTTTEKPYGPADAANSIEKDIATLTKSDTSKPTRIIIVKNFIGTELGSVEDPVYSSNTSETKVGKIAIDNATDDARAVIINAVVPTKLDTLISNDFDSDTETELFSDTFLSISVFSKEQELTVTLLEFTQDISNGEMKEVSKKFNEMETDGFSRQIVQSVTPSCAFIDDDGNFSTDGCHEGDFEPGVSLSCTCTHATVFAVLMSANIVPIPSGVKIISYITEAFSILFLLFTVLLLWKVRNRVRGDRVKVQICVAGAVLVLHILNVLHDAALQNEVTCAILTVLVHYFLLCSAMWMLMEGITLLTKTLDNVMRMLSGPNAKKFAIARYVLSFGIPFVIVLISASYGFSNNSYVAKNPLYNKNETSSMKYQFCWIGNQDIRIGAVITPIAVILMICLGVVIRMFYVVYKMSSESQNYKPTQLRRESSVSEKYDLEHIQAALKATLVLLPVLGVPWFLGFFTSIENGHPAQHVFMYLNAIVNGLQGVFLFFVYCVIGKEVRHAILKSYTRKKYALASSFEFVSKRRGTTANESTVTSLPVTVTTNLGDTYSMADDRSPDSPKSTKSDQKENNENGETKA